MSISDDGNIITLSVEGASCDTYFYGATVSSWKAAGSSQSDGEVQERFFLAKKACLDGSAPIRGGIPIAFPIFAVDTHPDYPDLGGAHGFARINRWQITERVEEAHKVAVTLSLEPNPSISSLFPPSFRLDYTITLTKHTLDTHLKIANTSQESFRFNTALHTYYLVPSSSWATLEPIDAIPFTSRLDPNSPHDLTDPAPALTGKHVARCYHLPSNTNTNTNTTFLRYNTPTSQSNPDPGREKEGVKITVEGGWKDCVFWNPGEEVKMGDLEHDGWEQFVCWEPGCIQELETVEAGGAWEGRQVCEAK